MRHNPYLTCCNGSCCDPAKCKSCVGGHCKVWCGDPNYYACCNGECYDIRTQKCCKDGEKEWPCDKYKECYDGSCCDPHRCKSCVSGHCKLWCGDPNYYACCNGSCCQSSLSNFIHMVNSARLKQPNGKKTFLPAPLLRVSSPLMGSSRGCNGTADVVISKNNHPSQQESTTHLFLQTQSSFSKL